MPGDTTVGPFVFMRLVGIILDGVSKFGRDLRRKCKWVLRWPKRSFLVFMVGVS